VSDGWYQDGRHGRESKPDEDRRRDGHRHAEATDTLQETGECPADHQRLHAARWRQRRQRIGQRRDGASLIRHAVEQVGAPHDRQNVERHEHAARQGHALNVERRPECGGGDGHGRRQPEQTGPRRRPAKDGHEQDNEQDGGGGEEPEKGHERRAV